MFEKRSQFPKLSERSTESNSARLFGFLSCCPIIKENVEIIFMFTAQVNRTPPRIYWKHKKGEKQTFDPSMSLQCEIHRLLVLQGSGEEATCSF